MVTFDPPDVAPATMLNTGEWIEFGAANGFHVKGTGRLALAQYMEGENAVVTAGVGLGDPSLTMAAPVEQYRMSYDFLSPDTYTASALTVIAPLGASITLDQQVMPIGNGNSIGGSGFGFLWINNLNAGAHHVSSNQPFGIGVSGVAPYTSYVYAGGLNLNQLAPQ